MTRVRAATPADAEAIAAIYAPHVLAGIASFETEAPDADGIAARMAASDGMYPWLVAIADSGEVMAYAYATRFRDRAAYRFVVETTVYVAEVAQRRGAGRLVYAALIETLRAQGFTQAIGAIALPNAGSVALHEAIGFRAAGMYHAVGYKFGRWIDVGYWQCALNAPAVPPVEPRPFVEVGVRK